MAKKEQETPQRPAQQQHRQPGLQTEMEPAPREERAEYRPSGKLDGKVALITGGDSGIGRSVAILFAKEGADVAICYLDEHEDANITRQRIEQTGRRCLALAGDVGDETFCEAAVARTFELFGRLDVLVNNAAEQHPQDNLLDITSDQLERTFRTNIFSCFYLTREAVKHLKPGAVVINTTSVTAYRGSSHLMDYAATKGAIVAFTRSLALNLVKQGIRVNGVAPGPIWTPLIPSTFEPEKVATFGSDVPMQRAGEPDEVAPCYVFLASSDSSYMTGQVLHPNGGEIINT
jgi:NAD(P)-dependent dehydrogenase (short-subunit alcohol dehydrogenase family)